ncbi:hypothetical protein TWF173_008024 [Orbilia oligospora]|uniref:Uncharacterized protein n=1 Tax=Orbilia oligospora TaxID=2813651 RepID=A0A7C8PTA7_ORBOL|nr:hypothetical protein TWF751_000861 [Orbilia oligospora]KAF3186268.1 hypothetical protein TWF225_004789 [Orbilia oligospora]KAF3260769.1 hypothetical protein TWF128_003392 [Orbilia oligospora]KAF3272714.1 hypothetical protein TWF217_000185 [Orbilia oligospora]KAF3292990.1 hypothetical protein TWF132_004996 [Orbilia oligospora]
MATKTTEIDFAKSVLITLSSKPVTIAPDHVEDLRKLPPRALFTLPKLPTTMSKPRDPSQPASATIHLKTLRPPQFINESLESHPLSSTVQSIKTIIEAKTGVPSDKLRLMIKGKILGDSKTLSEIAEDGGEVTISVMVTGGYTVPTAGSSSSAPLPDTAAVAEAVEKVETAEEAVKMDVDNEVGDVVKVLEGDEFWTDLEVFLRQKVGKEEVAKEVSGIFRQAWGNRSR